MLLFNPQLPASTVYYTTDGTTPTTASQIYEAPFLVASNLTVKAIAAANGGTPSKVNSQSFAPNIPSGTLVWSDEFTNTTGANAAPNPNVWTYDTGNSGFGNHELENYCAWGSNTAPCSTANPSAYRRYRWLPAHRGAATFSGRVHLGATQDAGAFQLSVRAR